MIGERLTDLLLQRGYNVSHLGRKKHVGKVSAFVWDPERQYIDPEVLRDVDAIVHLAGANIVEKRWTKKRMKEIIQSRVDSTKLIYDELIKYIYSIRAVI